MKAKFSYDLDYFYGMLRTYSRTAEFICKVRWDFVASVFPKTVLDFGSGCGFFKAFAPKGIEVDNIDVMDVPQTGIRRSKYDLVCFWDVLEHIADFNDILDVLSMTDNLAITVPVKPEGLAWAEYKHYKPLEHIHHFTEDSLQDLLWKLGKFKMVKTGTPECPPREMIHSFLFTRTNA